MKKPFIVEITGYVGLVIPTSNKYCVIIWNDGEIKEKFYLSWLTDGSNKILKSDLSEQEVLVWRLKHGV